MQLTALLLWIEETFPARFIATTPVAYPFVSAVHLFGIALVFGSIVPVDLRLLRVVGPQLDPALPSLIRIAVIGFAIAVPSGALLASIRITEYVQNPAFLAKMLILLAAGANVVLLRVLTGTGRVPGMVGGAAGRIAATASLSLWIAAVLAGRWIAFSS